MGVTNFPDGVNIGNDAGATALWQLGGTSVNVTADELNAIAVAGGLSGAELDVLDGAIVGTVVASKAVVASSSRGINEILITSGTVTTLTSTTATITTDNVTNLVLGGSTVTASAAELNYIATSVPGTAVASKALVLGAAKDIDTIDFASAGGIKIAGVALTASMAEINKLVGLVGAKVLGYDSATPQVVASGSTAITTAGTVASGMAHVGQVVASLASIGTASLAAFTVVADPTTVGGGSIVFTCYDNAGSAATAAGTVNWIAIGTAA